MVGQNGMGFLKLAKSSCGSSPLEHEKIEKK